MNWGKGIIIAMALFMGFILYMVVTFMRHNVDLESEDYYMKELKYDDEMIELKNGEAIKDSIFVSTSGGYLIVEYRVNFDIIKSTIYFFRPSDQKSDFQLNSNSEKKIIFPLEKLKQGKYTLNFHFETNEKSFLVKKEFFNPIKE
jgi:hypothetical protein